MNRKQKKIIALVLVAVLLISATWILASIRVAEDFMWDTHIVMSPEATGSLPDPPTATVIEIPQATPDDIELEMYYDSLEYLAMATEAEAGDQGLRGKKLVARVILNRVKSNLFPDDITSVINQKHQFEVVSNGSIWNVPTEETFKAVQQELAQSSDDRILFFTAGGYNSSGTPLYQYKQHYFSGK